MRPYEAMVVLRPALEEAALETILNRLTSIITDQGGEITHVDQWGKRRLAYIIDDHIEGFYVVMKFRGDAGITTELERIMRISDAVLRFLVVRDEIPVVAAAQPVAEEATEAAEAATVEASAGEDGAEVDTNADANANAEVAEATVADAEAESSEA